MTLSAAGGLVEFWPLAAMFCFLLVAVAGAGFINGQTGMSA